MRFRCSLYVEGNSGTQVVIDTGPEFRLQALRAGISRLDALFLTHAHADHIHGLDDVRPLSNKQPIPVYGNKTTIAEFRERFAYIFRKTQRGGGKPHIETRIVEAGKTIKAGELSFVPVPVQHGRLEIFGWKVCENGRSAVYLTDTSFIGEEAFRIMGKPVLLVIGALRKKPHETHFNFEQALAAALRIGAERTFLTHICHEHSHREIEADCRAFTENYGLSGVSPAWDGLTAEL
jgi:phosphoribosyl 1,2-cyclic phosphate phosphodiesterase